MDIRRCNSLFFIAAARATLSFSCVACKKDGLPGSEPHVSASKSTTSPSSSESISNPSFTILTGAGVHIILGIDIVELALPVGEVMYVGEAAVQSEDGVLVMC